jgi:hypothetical protein
MDEIVLLWAAVNACAFIGLLVFVPMATMELTGLVRLFYRIFNRSNKDGNE